MNTFNLKLITPSNELFNGKVVKIKSKNSLGEFEIFPNHINFITTTLATATEFVDDRGKNYKVFTSNGVINFSDNDLTFCCDAAEFPENIDLDRAKKAKERAEKRLTSQSDFDVKRAKLALTRALTRIDLKTN